MFGVKRFTSKSDKADIFLEDIHLSILKEQLTDTCMLALSYTGLSKTFGYIHSHGCRDYLKVCIIKSLD